MIKIDDVIVSDEVLEKKFICDINSCKGQCCVKGDAGAPLEKEDIKKLKKNYKHIKPYMTKKGIDEVEKKGLYVRGSDGDLETPIINGKECAYAFFDEKGTALCSIQKSFEDKKINWEKPISCALYPLRVKKYNCFTAINYHNWSICKSACSLGEKNKIYVFQFLKNSITKKFGSEWYEKLEKIFKKKINRRN